MDKYRVAILGTGKLATDLLVKVERSPYLHCSAFVGRNEDSTGIAFAKSRNIPTSHAGIDFLLENPSIYELVFDVTNAKAHLEHYAAFREIGKRVIDLTPSDKGKAVVPSINLEDAYDSDNIGLISCGGQASLPMIAALIGEGQNVRSIEVVSSISAKSAGIATRINIDEYVHKTESAIRYFSGCDNVKAILIINPAIPEINMKTTIYIEGSFPSMNRLEEKCCEMVKCVGKYVPGYSMKVKPSCNRDVVTVSFEVMGNGDFLPSYAGNLDIISAAAVQVAEAIAKHSLGVCETVNA